MDIKIKERSKGIEISLKIWTGRRSFVQAAMVIVAVISIFCAANKADAQYLQEIKQMNSISKSDIRFPFTLPQDTNKYTEILRPPQTITMRSGLVRLEPAGDVGLHSTKKNEEMLVILEGQGEIVLEGKTRQKIAGGQVAYVPPETKHNVRNTGAGPLKYIFIVSKAID